MQESAGNVAAVEALQAKVDAQDAELEQVQADAADAEAAVKAVAKELDLVGGEPMRQQRDLVAQLKQVCAMLMAAQCRCC